MKNIKLKLSVGLVIIIILFNFPYFQVNDASVKIRPYNKNDHGKFWDICIDHSNFGPLDNPYAFFYIELKDGYTTSFNISFIHLKEECNVKNILLETPQGAWNKIKGIDPEDINFVRLRIQKNYKATDYIFEKIFNEEDLKLP